MLRGYYKVVSGPRGVETLIAEHMLTLRQFALLAAGLTLALAGLRDAARRRENRAGRCTGADGRQGRSLPVPRRRPTGDGDGRECGRHARPALSIRRRGARRLRLQRTGRYAPQECGDSIAENRAGTAARGRAHRRRELQAGDSSSCVSRARSCMSASRSTANASFMRPPPAAMCGSIRSPRRPTPGGFLSARRVIDSAGRRRQEHRQISYTLRSRRITGKESLNEALLYSRGVLALAAHRVARDGPAVHHGKNGSQIEENREGSRLPHDQLQGIRARAAAG